MDEIAIREYSRSELVRILRRNRDPSLIVPPHIIREWLAQDKSWDEIYALNRGFLDDAIWNAQVRKNYRGAI